MVPVAGQNAVLDAPAVEWKAHMRTAVVEGKELTLVFNDQNGAMRAADDEPSFGPEFLDRPCALEFGPHNHASCCRGFWPSPTNIILPASCAGWHSHRAHEPHVVTTIISGGIQAALAALPWPSAT